MNLNTYLNTPNAIQNATFVQARKDWLSIMLHDATQGAHNDLIDDFLASPSWRFFDSSDAQVVTEFNGFVRLMRATYTYRYEAVNMLCSLGYPANFVLAAIDQTFNYDQEDGDLRELLWESDDARGGEFFPTPQTGTSILIAYKTMVDMMRLEGWHGTQVITLDGEPAYSSTGVNLVWLDKQGKFLK